MNAVYAVVGALDLVRSHIDSPIWKARLDVLSFVPHLSTAWWIAGFLLIAFLSVIEGSYRHSATMEAKLLAAGPKEPSPREALKIRTMTLADDLKRIEQKYHDMVAKSHADGSPRGTSTWIGAITTGSTIVGDRRTEYFEMYHDDVMARWHELCRSLEICETDEQFSGTTFVTLQLHGQMPLMAISRILTDLARQL
ncbi:MAG: hypothetical protein ACREN3_00850 [Gemmatimonadaceae bacterium]